MPKAKKALKLLLIATVVVALVYAAIGTVSLLRSEFTSFPWWSNLVFTAIYFGPVIVVEALALLGVHIWGKRNK